MFAQIASDRRPERTPVLQSPAPRAVAAPDALVSAIASEYRMVRELGAGGMATVFLAEDLRHGRQVAIKVVREELAASVGGSRFLREIQIAARLQHSHILPLLDSGEAAGVLYYVMPYVSGESLRQRLDREGELPIPDALRLITQVVDALACAHGHGVVHRDIKSDNVLLAGRNAMVMDFGIAKAMRDAAAPSEASSTMMTQVGMAMGTPAYMAPEQAAADPAMDHRVDLYAVGVLAYEILTGGLPFEAASPQAMLAAHLTQAPEPVANRRPTVPPPLASAVMRCLEKRPADRWQTADELLAALEMIASTASGGVPASRVQTGSPVGRRRGILIGGAVAGVAMAAAGGWYAMQPGAPERLEVGRSQQFTNVPELEIHPALSPDGKFVAFAAGTAHSMRIFIRPVAGGRTIALSDDTTAMEYFPSWSPDGTQLAFVHNGSVAVAPSLGGDARTVVPAAGARSITSITWSPEGDRVAFTRGDTLFAAPVTTGAATVIGTASDVHSCQWAPTGPWIACTTRNSSGQIPTGTFGNRAPSGIVVFPSSGGVPVEVVPSTGANLAPSWSPSGTTLYFLSDRDGPRDVFAVRLTGSGKPAGETVRITTGLDALALSLSRDGTRLIYNVYTSRANVWRLPIPASGSVSAYRADALTTGNQVVEAMAVSTDGQWLVFDSNVRGNSDIFRMPVMGGATEQLTSEPWDEFGPSLSPDNAFVTYHSFRNGTRDVEVKAVGSSSPAVRATDTGDEQESYPRWSPDGSRIAFNNQGVQRGVAILPRQPDGRFGALLPIGEGQVTAWSPDGSRLYYLPFAARSSGADAESDAAITEYEVASGRSRSIPAKTGLRRSRQLCVSADGRTAFVKGFTAAGDALIVAVPMSGGTAQPVVTFGDAARPSTRGDFACGKQHFFFTIDEMESDLFVAEVSARR